MAANLGIVDEEAINNMSYVWFTMVLEALGRRLDYESVSNLYGNSFAKDAAKIVSGANPLMKPGTSRGAKDGFLGLVGKTKVISAGVNKKAAIKEAEKSLGDMSWAEGLL